MSIPTIDVAALGKVAVLLGGTSAEREISLMSGNGVLAALQSAGVDATAFDPATRELIELKRHGYARCFIALHGRHGEDGTVQGALELLGVPYTGSGVMASAIAMDKVMTKRVWVAEGLPTPRFVRLAAGEQGSERVRTIPDELGLPLIVKPPREGSSIGITKVAGYSQIQDAVRGTRRAVGLGGLPFGAGRRLQVRRQSPLFEDGSGKVEPRRLAGIGDVVDAGGAAVEQVERRGGEVEGISRAARLVVHDAERLSRPGDVQHGLHEVGAVRAVEPGGADDQPPLRRVLLHSLFPGQFRLAIDALRPDRVVRTQRSSQ
jgi:hypothetical protein